MHRRRLLLCASLALVSAAPAHAAISPLERIWHESPQVLRHTLKRKLTLSELYFGEIDGLWTRATDRGLRRAADRILLKQDGGLRPDLRRAAGIRSFFDALANGDLDRALFPGEALKNRDGARWYEGHFGRS